MTTIQKLLTHVLIAAALTGVAASAAEPFIRAGANYTCAKFDSLTRQNGWEAGPVISAGYTFGSTNQQEISLESGWAKWNGTSVVGGSKYETTQIPVLLDYRYSFTFSKDFGLFVGPTAGFIHQKYEVSNVTFPRCLAARATSGSLPTAARSA